MQRASNYLLNLILVGIWLGEAGRHFFDRTRATFLAAIVSLVVCGQHAIADSGNLELEAAETRARVRDALKSSIPKLRRRSAAGAEEFCRTFLHDLRTENEVTFVQPVVQTDDPNSPALRAYQGCDNEDEKAKMLSNTLPYEGVRDLGDKAFRVYRVRLDDRRDEEPAEVFYAELNAEVAHPDGVTSGYKIVDLKRCLIEDIIPVHAATSRIYTTVVRHRGVGYLIELDEDPSRSGYTLSLTRFPRNIKGNDHLVPCIWASD